MSCLKPGAVLGGGLFADIYREKTLFIENFLRHAENTHFTLTILRATGRAPKNTPKMLKNLRASGAQAFSEKPPRSKNPATAPDVSDLAPKTKRASGSSC